MPLFPALDGFNSRAFIFITGEKLRMVVQHRWPAAWLPALTVTCLISVAFLSVTCSSGCSDETPADRNASLGGGREYVEEPFADKLRRKGIRDVKKHLEYPEDAQFDPGLFSHARVVRTTEFGRFKLPSAIAVVGRVGIQNNQGIRRLYRYLALYDWQPNSEQVTAVIVMLDDKVLWQNPDYDRD